MARKAQERNYKLYVKNIYSFFSEQKRMPSFEELKDILEVRSKDTVSRIVEDLVNMDYVTKDEKGRILPILSLSLEYAGDRHINNIKKIISKKNSFNQGVVRILGNVEAGFPTHIEMDELDTITLDEWMLGDRSATFMLKVKGDSMLDAGICEGDFVIVERAKEPKIGSIVLAEVDGAWTLKYYRKDKSGVFLEPANKKYKIIRPKHSLDIPAVVVGLVRKYAK